jgi:hypothetical protein
MVVLRKRCGLVAFSNGPVTGSSPQPYDRRFSGYVFVGKELSMVQANLTNVTFTNGSLRDYPFFVPEYTDRG